MKTEELISCAEYIICRPEPNLTQVDINRAASTCYYALFHELSKTCANLFMGDIHPDYRRAWQQVYRALGHENAKSRCRQSEMIGKFPAGIQDFASKFVTLQDIRHQCDYDPFSETTKTTVEAEIESIRQVIQDFASTPEMDLRAFCSFILFPLREDLLRKQIEEQRESDRAKAKVAAEIARGPAIREERAARKAKKETQSQNLDHEVKA